MKYCFFQSIKNALLCKSAKPVPRHFFPVFFGQISLKTNCSLLNVVFIYSQIRLIWCKASTDQYACSILIACVCFGILISNQNTEMSIYVVANTSRWHEASMRSVVPVLHVWTRWFDACGWHSFLYQFQVSDNMYSRKYVRTAWSVHEIWGTSTASVELLVRC